MWAPNQSLVELLVKICKTKIVGVVSTFISKPITERTDDIYMLQLLNCGQVYWCNSGPVIGRYLNVLIGIFNGLHQYL
jgi:hypothetical protein